MEAKKAGNARANARGKGVGGYKKQGRGNKPKGANAKPTLPRAAASE